MHIENQFFISSLPKKGVRNSVAHELMKRISRAIKEQHTFRAVIVLPLYPAGDWRAASVRQVAKWQLYTIEEMLSALSREHPDADLSRYITFHALITHGRVGGKLYVGQVYVHAKLLIVDDRVVVCGSANVNDRSLKGTRDSEICVVIEDHETVSRVDAL